jgi:hypothetical protein
MSASPRVLFVALPAFAVLAACDSSPTLTAPPPDSPSMPMTSGVSAANSGMMTELSGSTTPPSQPIRLTSVDIQSMLVNNTATGTAGNGETYYAWFGPTGQIRFEQGTLRDTGTWRTLPDGRLCSLMTRHQADGEECYSLYRSGDALTYDRPDGSPIGNFAVLAGNPRDL